ncbi:hypothetical protein SCH4B_2217 [Ruegeria sp. TrichCH4B]|nr:hypothetical protein SCH4B_2217 [Ruegeria sp. TrichCH4B]
MWVLSFVSYLFVSDCGASPERHVESRPLSAGQSNEPDRAMKEHQARD